MILETVFRRAPLKFGLVAALICCSGCLPSDYDVEITVISPDGVPLAGLEITVLPFDRDALRDSLAVASGVAKPSYDDLEAALLSYELPDLSHLETSFLPWQAIYDSVRRLADSLHEAGADRSNSYAAAYDRLRSQYQRLARSTVERDDAIREHVGDDKELAMRAAAAADSLRAWEGAALASYPELVDSAIAMSMRSPQSGNTNTEGVVEFTLVPGQWWIVAAWPDPKNPFREEYWNVGLSVRLFGSKSIVLNSENSRATWRY